MALYCHTEAPREHLVCRFIHACLTAHARQPQASATLVHSWRAPEGHLEVTQFPGVRTGTAPSVESLVAELQPTHRLTVHPQEGWGAVVSVGDARDFGEASTHTWVWQGLTPPPGIRPSFSMLPVLEERRAAPPAGAPGRVMVWLDPPDFDRLAPELEVVARIRAVLPGRLVQFRWDQLRLETGDPGTVASHVPDCPAERAEIVVVLGRSLAWAPLVLQAMGEGRQVVLCADAAYLPLLSATHPRTWSGVPDAAGLGELADLFVQIDQDPAAHAQHRRRTVAWARRWTPEREGQKLLALAASNSTASAAVGVTGAVPTSRRPRWVVRREVGVGDILFTLSVAAELKRRHPGLSLRFHTAALHAPWVAWFPQVDEVSHGPFQARWGERVGDFEATFPGTVEWDRTVAFGAEIGLVPEQWSPPPAIPPDWQERGCARVGSGTGLRIAFASASKGHSPTRSLSRPLAEAIAARLAELGEVFWLDAEPPPQPAPAGVSDLRGALSFPEVWAVLERCDGVVSVDSGLLHAGVTLGKRVVGLFTHIGALQRLWLAPRFVALQPSLPCAPCGEGPEAFHCLRGVPPARDTSLPVAPPCAAFFSPETVAAAARELLSLPATTPRYRRVWNVASDGSRTVWEVDALPPPHARLLPADSYGSDVRS